MVVSVWLTVGFLPLIQLSLETTPQLVATHAPQAGTS
jgi:hypothetical protein